MLNVSINYPYPVIRPYSEDYIDTVFDGDLRVTPESDGYYIRPNFSINNAVVGQLIEEGSLTYAVEIECASTWLRKLVVVDDNNPIRLDPTHIHETVELTPCIIAKAKIKDYSNDDFAEEYKAIKYTINIGEVVAIGQKKTFDAFYQNDIIKNGSSIVSVEKGNSLREAVCDFNGNQITLTLPSEQFDKYLDCGYNRAKYKMLSAILYVPVVVEAIGIIAADENDSDHLSGLDNKSWYKTIVANLKRYAENDEGKYNTLLTKPFTAAQIILGNNSADALSYLSRID